MKILFESCVRNAACTQFYNAAFSYCHDIDHYKFEHANKYDCVLFMTYKQDLEKLRCFKSKFPHIKTGIIDPRGGWVDSYLKFSDFLIVDSLEMYDFWSYSSLPIFTYVEYPDVGLNKKNHVKSDKIIIGYHGNKIHLESMYDRIIPAIEKLAFSHDIELWAMYNIEDLGEWAAGLPKNVAVRNIQWSMDNYHNELTKVDIAINPCFTPINNDCNKTSIFFNRKKKNRFNETSDDYVVRFKMSSNPGRIVVWGYLGVPVVSDFIPSAIQCIDHGYNGYLAYNSGGWYSSLLKLAEDHQLRQKFSDKMQKYVVDHFDFNVQNEKFINFLSCKIFHS